MVGMAMVGMAGAGALTELKRLGSLRKATTSSSSSTVEPSAATSLNVTPVCPSLRASLRDCANSIACTASIGMPVFFRMPIQMEPKRKPAVAMAIHAMSP
eukprot:1195448-Prorocentrum_minimum.AAC.8